MKLQELLRQTERRLAAARLHYGHGTDNPRDEAAYLVLRGLGLAFECDLEIEITKLQSNRVERLLRKRLHDRIPVAYLLNEAWLGGLPFYVDRRVIVPRSHLAELLQLRLRPWLRRPPRRILDLCTGSGCLAVLAAKAFPGAAVDATDVSAAALAVAAINVKKFKLMQRIRLVRSELFSALQNRRYDLIVSNPPYVTTASLRRLPPEYRYSSFSRPPERPSFLERGPRGPEGNDEHALARGERQAGIRSSMLGCAAGRSNLGKQASRHGDVVEVSKNVL